MSLLKSLKNAGVKYATNSLEKRSIVITNIVALTLVSLGLSLSVIYLLLFGITPTFLGILSISVAGLLTIALNFRGQINIGKTHLALFVPIFATVLSVYAKIHGKDPSATLDYFNYRIIILGTCTFPWLLFSLSERKILIANASLNLFILMMYDPIHTWFGIPYKNASFTDTDYIFFNVVFLITYLMTSVSLLVMKSILEKSEQTTFRLVHKLNMANVALKTKNTAFEHQTSTLISKSEALEISQKNLLEAYEVIQEQKKQLISQNEDLTGALLQKNKDLTKANNELIKHNHELRQFSYTVSHNLRGPVASLLGLIELFRWETLTEENSNVAKHIRSSGKLLDSVIKDLTKIIDIRNDIFQIRQKINIHQEVELVLETLNKKENHSSTIRYHLDTPDFYSVKPMIHSILYNLVSIRKRIYY
jgi:signal transduction histidine kinase